MSDKSHLLRQHFCPLTRARDTEGSATLVFGHCLTEPNLVKRRSTDERAAVEARGAAAPAPLPASLEPIKGWVTTPACEPHFLSLCLLVKPLSSFNPLMANSWPWGRNQRRTPQCGTGMREPRLLQKAGLCSMLPQGPSPAGGSFLSPSLSGSAPWELHKGICIRLAFENTLRFQKKKKIKSCVGLSPHSHGGCEEESGRQGGLLPKGWLLLCHLLLGWQVLTGTHTWKT